VNVQASNTSSTNPFSLVGREESYPIFTIRVDNKDSKWEVYKSSSIAEDGGKDSRGQREKMDSRTGIRTPDIHEVATAGSLKYSDTSRFSSARYPLIIVELSISRTRCVGAFGTSGLVIIFLRYLNPIDRAEKWDELVVFECSQRLIVSRAGQMLDALSQNRKEPCLSNYDRMTRT